MIASVSSLRRAAPLKAMTVRAMMSSWLAEVPQGPPDALFGLIDAYNKDPATKKISLGIGAYRGDDGAPYVLPVVRKAEKVVLEAAMNHEYAGIQGVDDFLKVSFEFVYRPPRQLAAGRVGVQVFGHGRTARGGQFLRALLRRGLPHLPSQSDLGQSHTHLQGRGARRAELHLLRPRDPRPQFCRPLRRHEGGTGRQHIPALRLRAQPHGRGPDARSGTRSRRS